MVRSCYTVGMRFSESSGVIPCRWFFADGGAKYLDAPTAFYSRNWEDKASKFDTLGEQPGNRRWSNGQRPALALGRRLCDPVELFLLGPPPGVTLNRDVVPGPVPACCLDPLGAGLGGDGFKSDGATRWDGSGAGVGGGAGGWKRVQTLPAFYLKTIIPNPTPGLTAVGMFTCQVWTLRLQVTAIAPGGGGGGAKGGVASFAAGGGGSCGATKLQFWLGVFYSLSFPWQIGGFGAGGPAGNNPGSPGTGDTIFTGPTTVTAAKGLGGSGGPAIPFITGGSFSPGGVSPVGGNPGIPGLVIPSGSGNTGIGGAGACSTVGGAGGFTYSPGSGKDATPGTGSGGGGAVAAGADEKGGDGADGFLVVEEWNF